MDQRLRVVVQSCASVSSQDVLDDFARTILLDPRTRLARKAPALDGCARALGRLAEHRPAPMRKMRRGVPRGASCLVLMMGPAGRPYLPGFILSGCRCLYLFDAWPSTYSRIIQVARCWGVDHLFVSASQAADALGALLPECRVSWVPEGVNPEQYRSLPAADRDIDVVQFGRKHDLYHEAVQAGFAKAGRSYVYEETKGTMVYPTRRAFVDGLSRAKISVCFPSSVTHPARSADTETMTQRYLQSMAARCLVVGQAPSEMIRLFGYDPLIEADLTDPAGQLIDILDSYDDYLPLVDRNQRVVNKNHTWAHRWELIAGRIGHERR